jgi:hypothetical protein
VQKVGLIAEPQRVLQQRTREVGSIAVGEVLAQSILSSIEPLHRQHTGIHECPFSERWGPRTWTTMFRSHDHNPSDTLEAPL